MQNKMFMQQKKEKKRFLTIFKYEKRNTNWNRKKYSGDNGAQMIILSNLIFKG